MDWRALSEYELVEVDECIEVIVVPTGTDLVLSGVIALDAVDDDAIAVSLDTEDEEEVVEIFTKEEVLPCIGGTT